MAIERSGAGSAGLMGLVLASRPGSSLLDIARRRSLFEVAGALALALMILFASAYSLLRHDYNWDIVAYVGVALENRHADAASLHAETWKQVEAVAPADAVERLKFANDYTRSQWENPANFQSQLSMYRVKAGFTQLIRLFEPVFGVVTGAIVLHVVTAVAFGLVVLWMLLGTGTLQGGLVLAPVLFLAGYSRMTAAVSPDMLLAAMSLAALYCLLKGRDWTASALLFASVFIRPDNIIFIFALLIAAVLFGWRRTPMAVTFVAALAACLVNAKLFGHPGWWPHFYFSTVQIQNSMAGFAPDFSVVAMAKGYARGVIMALQDFRWPFLLALMLICWAALNRFGRIVEPRANALLFAMAIGVMGKFVNFPLPDDRFYFNFIAGMAVLLVIAGRPRFDTASK